MILLFSQGCSANLSESEQIAGLLAENNFEVEWAGANKNENIEAVILNLCTVKGDSSALKAVRNAKENYPDTPMLVTGCTTPELITSLQKIDSRISAASTHAVERIPGLLKRIIAGEIILDTQKEHSPKLGIPKIRKNPIVGIVSIAEGCMDACSFCSTRMVKGRLKSYVPEQIVNEAKTLVEGGCKEIWLTAQDAACYGFDIGTDLAELVLQILLKVKGDYRIRMGMGNPRHTLGYADKLVEVYRDSRVFKFLHLPVQSGSNGVLQAMKRKHSVEDYKKLVNIFYSEFSDFAISTDIIVGFPGETEADFQQSLDLIKWSKPTGCNRTRFVPRRGTVAAAMPNQIPSTEKYARSAELTKVFTEVALQNNSKYIGRELSILIDEVGKRNSWLGRANNYKPVAVHGDYKIGDMVNVKIKDAEAFALIGEEKNIRLCEDLLLLNHHLHPQPNYLPNL
ncbi:MAG: tRNA (N(6)-L-threonylcarbamoyladenosine(37)-C(2))-methylthiotransferase [Fibromonadaceae bacterium]|jgi:MiaB-like tRNA modifying enzyme|nr:tRNA (N(6)-L-threonylcarbamoyladenosine(37)-C(2))-methylthiotransferase [Fibromonadaceae bacterium]